MSPASERCLPSLRGPFRSDGTALMETGPTFLMTQEEADKLDMSLETFERCLDILAEQGRIMVRRDETGRKLYSVRKPA
jgi:hypothetical protein